MKYVLLLIAGACAAGAAQPDPVADAMQAELKRSMALTLNELDKPYYLSYSVDDEHAWSASASLGGLISASDNLFRIPNVRIRVGDYRFDNTNWTGANAQGPRYGLGSFPLDNDPLVIRQYLWLFTDSAFKGSLQSIARKRAALRNVTVNDQLPDFERAPAFTLIRDYTPKKFDQAGWVERIRHVSEAFDRYRGLRNSNVEYTVIDSLHRFINSEGTQLRFPETIGEIEMRASSQASDGMILRDSVLLYTHDIDRMFPEPDLTKAAHELGDRLEKLAAAPMGENYTGPVLFEGQASPQLLAQILGRNLHIARKPVAQPGSAVNISATELEGRRGVRIMPEFFTVVDDPTQPLFGREEVDEEGVPEKPLILVEKGVLKDFLRTRQPVRGYSDSNGRARLSGGFGAEAAAPTNLVVRASETNPVSDLRKKLIDLCEQRGLPYGLIVRKLDFPSSASVEEARRLLGGAGSARPVSIPLLAYRLYTDGHEELVRGQRFRGINARSLKDILAAGDDSVRFDYLENGAPFALLGAGSTSAEVSVVAPSLLVDDLDVVRAEDELPNLPVVASPLSLSQTASAR